MDGLKVHPRVLVVQKAEAEVEEVLAKVADKHKLTCPELIGILARFISLITKSLLQAERHPNDPEKRSGEL